MFRAHRPPIILVSLVLMGLFLGCIFESKEARRGSVVENEVAGMLFVEGGERAVGAVVRVYPVSHVPKGGLAKAAADSEAIFISRTDKEGRYHLDSLGSGEYNILAELDGVFSYQDSVLLSTGLDSIPSDTLLDPGSVTGHVVLEPNADPRAVFIQILGTNRYATTDTGGWFTLRNLAAGEYSIRVMTILPEYNPFLGSIVIRSGLHDTLAQPIRMAFVGVPVVQGLKATYDTATSRARISWNPAAYRFLKEYLVFRNDAASLDLPDSPIARVRDSFYQESLEAAAADTAGGVKRFEYRVRIRNLSDRDGLVFGSIILEAAPKHLVATVVAIEDIDSSGMRGGPRDSIRLAVRWSNPRRNHDTLHWYAGAAGTPIRSRNISGKAGRDTLVLVLPSDPGDILVTATLRDQAGDRWSGSASFRVVQDIPTANAGQDTSVTPYDTVFLHGRAWQEFGSITKWEWDFGNKGVFAVMPSGEAAIKAGSVPGYEMHVLRVTDEDGHRDVDTVRVLVIPGSPKASAGSDTTVTPFDAVILRGRGTDKQGLISKMEWDIGGTGAFVHTRTGDTAVQSKGIAGTEIHVLRVTDDDGITDLDTIKVNVILDRPSALAGHDTTVTVADSVILRGRGTDGRGRIVTLEWDIGARGTFVVVATGDTTLRMGSGVGTSLNILRVTDDDGISHQDTMKVLVQNDEPLINTFTSENRQFAAGGGYTFRVGASDIGRIVQWAWDIGNTGTWVLGGPDTSFIPAVPGGSILNIKVRVTDDDGNSSFFSKDITVTKWSWVDTFDSADAIIASYPNFNAIQVMGMIYCFATMSTASFTETILWRFNPASGNWTRLKPMPMPSILPSLAVVGGKIYAIGGDNNVTAVRVYDPEQDTWILKKEGNPIFLGGIAESGGKLYLTGGRYSGNTLFEYDPVQDTWATKGAPPVDMKTAAMASEGGKLYLFGSDGVRSWSYDIIGNSWKGIATMPMNLGSRSALVLEGKIFMLGSHSDWKKALVYDPALNSYQEKSPLLVPSGGVQSIVSVLDRIYSFSDNLRLGTYRLIDDP